MAPRKEDVIEHVISHFAALRDTVIEDPVNPEIGTALAIFFLQKYRTDMKEPFHLMNVGAALAPRCPAAVVNPSIRSTSMSTTTTPL
jgi:hypothetical protein